MAQAVLQTPWSLRARSRFYAELAQMAKAGFVITTAFEKLSRDSATAELRSLAGQIAGYLKLGKPLEEILKRMGADFPLLDSSMIIAGDRSGRLENTFRALGIYYEQSAVFREKIFQSMGYPVFLLFIAIFTFPSSHFKVLVGKGLGYFLLLKSPALILLFGLLLLPFLVLHNDSPLRERIEKFMARIPLFGSAISYSYLARFCAFLEGLVSAGFKPDESWPLAARASGSRQMEKAVAVIVSGIRSGKSPTTMLSPAGPFPREFIEQIKTGELTGQMEETLQRLGKYYQERADARFQSVLDWTGRGFKLIVLVLIGYQIVASLGTIEVPQIE